MKRNLFFIVLCGCLLLTACGSQPGAAEPEESSSSRTAPEASSEVPQLPNPMQEYETPDFTEEAGFAVTGWPQMEDLRLERCWLISGKLGQLDFVVEDHVKATLRIASEQWEDISGVYGQKFESTTLQEMNGVPVEISNSAGGPALARWSQNGYSLSLWMPQTPMGMFGGLLPMFMEELTLSPAVSPDGLEPPVIPASGTDFAGALGFTVAGLPEEPLQSWVVRGEAAQLDLPYEEYSQMILRIAQGEDRNIGGLYFLQDDPIYSRSWHPIEETEAMIQRRENGDVRITWNRDGYSLSLWMPCEDLNTALPLVEEVLPLPVEVEEPQPEEDKPAQ